LQDKKKMPAPISIIAAVAANGVIGANNDLPWRLSADLARFRRLTMGCPLIMGRHTHNAIGKPLAGRTNIVISRDCKLRIPGCEVASSIAAALDIARALSPVEIFIIGGAQIYRQTLEIADKLYITEIKQAFAGDAFFPKINRRLFAETARENGEENGVAFDFAQYRRVKS
jgi:dihydrofolate reductase